MKAFLRTETVVWFGLTAATALSWAVGAHSEAATNHAFSSGIVIVVAFIKIRFIFRRFMGLHAAHWVLRALADTWIIATTTVLLGLIWFP